jgi:hypothetical protein
LYPRCAVLNDLAGADFTAFAQLYLTIDLDLSSGDCQLGATTTGTTSRQLEQVTEFDKGAFIQIK